MTQVREQGVRELRKCLLYVKNGDNVEFITDMYDLGNGEYMVNDYGKYMVGTPMQIATYFLNNETEYLSGLEDLGVNVNDEVSNIKRILMALGSDKLLIVCEDHE